MKEHEARDEPGGLKPAPVRLLPSGVRWPHRVSEVAACGPVDSPIRRRDQAEFDALVVYDNPVVVVKDEEGTGADRRVTALLRDCLDTLAGLVLAEWPGVRLRVTEAWDESGEHSTRSLHYEARAADMTTSDRDGAKLPRLGGLATEAGFGWVQNEGDHIHASVRRDPPVEG